MTRRTFVRPAIAVLFSGLGSNWLAISESEPGFDYPDLDDETLAQVADELWQIYDADEAANRHSTGTD